MKKSLLIIAGTLVLISVTLGRVLSPSPRRLVFAEDGPLETDFADTTLFDQDNMLPGDDLVGRYFTVTNTSVDTSYPLYFVGQKTGGDGRTPVDFASVLTIEIEKEGGPVVYDDTLGTLFDKVDDSDGIDENDGFSLDTTLEPSESQKFFISVEFDEASNNDFQSKDAIWSAVLGFVGGAPEDVLAATTGGNILGIAVGANLIYSVLGSLTSLAAGLYLRRRSFSKKAN